MHLIRIIPVEKILKSIDSRDFMLKVSTDRTSTSKFWKIAPYIDCKVCEAGVESAVPVYMQQTMEWNKTWYVCHIYIKESLYAFIDSKLYGKVAFVCKRSRMYKKAV